MAETDAALHRNWAILIRLLDGRYRRQVQRSALEVAGFQWKYLTEFFISEQGRTFYLVYDCAWTELPEGSVLIVRKGWREEASS
ncbi:MAG: hypothetical protein RMJ33_13620 [Saprospiraceae bacterium]|nr:hypothetical protein [Saprospiraceae bacterium]MDW8230866.1 hypothetical protein [Saprospiraceae bacterium]